MATQHIAELESALTEPLVALCKALEAGELEAARNSAVEAWPLLERRIGEKWQAYFIMTLQDVSVERKAARDRRQQRSGVGPSPVKGTAQADAARRSLPALQAHRWDDEPRTRVLTPWIAVVALLLLAAASGWLLLRVRAHRAATNPAAPTAAP